MSHTRVRFCVHEGCARARGGSPPSYSYGQVEPLVLLNLITSEVAEDRYFRVSFPGNRPRDSAASVYFIPRVYADPDPFLPPSFFISLSLLHLAFSPIVRSSIRSSTESIQSHLLFTSHVCSQTHVYFNIVRKK